MAPWNGSGTFGLSDTVTADTDATADETNAIFQDLANGINNSLAKDGQTTMTGALKASSGAVGTPSITFGADLDTGFYRKASDKIGITIGGNDIAEISADGLKILSGNFRGQGSMPAGSVSPYAGSSAPSGWLLCDGSAVSRTTYADLFTAISTTYGAGDESTTFNLPDLRGRVVAGKDNMGGTSADRLTDQSGGLDGDTLGDTGGEETHTLSKSELPELGLEVTISDPGHTHTLTAAVAGSGSGINNGNNGSNTTVTTASATTGISASIAEVGGGDAHNNVQPTIILNYIIKT